MLGIPKSWILLAVLLSIYGCFKIVYPSGTWRYKLTLVVETPEGKIIGSAVRKVSAVSDPEWFPESVHGHAGVKGEAVVVDLGKRGVLFALLKGNDDNDYGYNIIFNEFKHSGGTTPEGIKFYSNLKASKELAFDKLPMLVRFRDINDPKTVEKVDPNNLAASFGEGVKLVSAKLEMTDEGVTKGVERWISKISWKEHGFAEWRSNLRYDQVIFDWEDFERK